MPALKEISTAARQALIGYVSRMTCLDNLIDPTFLAKLELHQHDLAHR